MQQSQQESSQGSSVFNLTIEGFKQLQTYGIDLNHLFVLECLAEGTDIAKHISSSKVAAWKQNLYRKSLTTEKGEVTTLGKNLLSSLSSSQTPRGDVMAETMKEVDWQFEKWWKAYPTTDAFTQFGRVFSGSRGLRLRKEECRKKFNEILLEGEYSAEDLIRALVREVNLKMQQSMKDNENKMKYMQNTLTYLNQRTFENFILKEDEMQKTQLPINPGTIDI
jgi:hypothetical protein